jgi:hypothetical protein
VQVRRHQAVDLDHGPVCQGNTVKDGNHLVVESPSGEMSPALQGIDGDVKSAVGIGIGWSWEAYVFPPW